MSLHYSGKRKKKHHQAKKKDSQELFVLRTLMTHSLGKGDLRKALSHFQWL